MDLKDYNINYSTQKKNKYALQSFAIHSSGDLHGGHYYANCKNYLEEQWYRHNDTRISKLSKEEVTKEIPYLFVYKRL